MSKFIKHENRTTRTSHYCFGCGTDISPKTTVYTEVISDGGKIYTLYWCDACKDFYDKHCNNEEVYEGDVGQLRYEYDKENKK